MEIQGHSDARNRNIHSQHGVLHGTCFDLAVANTGGLQDLSKQHDNSNHARPRTSLFHLPVENGSQLACSPTSTRSAKVQPDTATVVLRNVNIDKEIIASLGTQKILRMPVKSGIAGDDIILQKELPQIEGGEVVRQRQLPFPLPVLRLHPKDGAAKVSFVARPKASVPGILNSMKETDGSVKSLFISRGEDRPTPSHDEEDCDVVSSSPRAEDCDRDDIRPLALVKSKKENVSSFSCPEPGCSCIFITRQKLKVHLLNHTEDPRPYQCSVDGCGWAFATSYKLKRHLQSHNKQRPHICQFEGCGRSFTTVYNLKAHVKVHEQDNAFICEICSERFHSATRLTNHQKVHFEPQRPHKCEFPGCGKTFITFSALFSHNRTHFRETGQFLCNYPGCDKMYDKACRLKIHLRSHTGERPFVCDSEGCGWSFTSMSKLLRHKRKHDDDRRFVCTEEGCGKSFTRAEHLKGHSITHLGTKPFHCHAEGCSAKFSARSSLYIHSKKHKQDADSSRSRCPLTNCFKHFSSRSNLKSHIVKHHQLNADILNQMEIQPTLTPSSELISSPPMNTAGHGGTGGDQLPSLDLGSMLSAVPEGTICSAGIGVGMSSSSSTFTMDLSLVSPSILTIDPSVGSLPGTSTSNSSDKVADPINLAASANTGPAGDVITPKGTFNLDDMTVSPRVLRSLTSLTMHDCEASLDPSLEHPIRPSNTLNQEPSTSLANASAPELLDLPSKVVELGGPAGAGTLPGCVEVLGAQESGKVSTQLVYPRSSSSTKKDTDPNLVSPSSILEIVGSARTDYRAIQLAKRKKQKGPPVHSGTMNQWKSKVAKTTVESAVLATSLVTFDDVATTANEGMVLRDSVPRTQYVQIQLLQDDPASDGDLAFQLSTQPTSSHSQLTVDLPVNILQEPSVMPEDDNASDNTQFTGSTINLQDLE
uniref:Zinc finger protein ZXDC-like n=1 Tax=Gouania willdenowi TaxID=441366 RepID=A0A8C5DV68_GOUWI